MRSTVMLLAALLLAACGKTPAPDAPPAAANGANTAEPARKDGIPPPRCPARPAEGEGLDLGGLRLGEPALQALDRLRCKHPDARLTSEPRWVQELPQSSAQLGPQLLELKRGVHKACSFKSYDGFSKCDDGVEWQQLDEHWRLGTPGLAGQQRVGAIWWQQRFGAEQRPSMERSLQALVQKFGAPSAQDRSGKSIRLYWQRDLAGQPAAAPTLRDCPRLYADAGGSMRWQEGCGLSIAADLETPQDNPELVAVMRLAMLDQQGLTRQVDALRNGMQGVDAARRAQQRQKADQQQVKL